jgi:hypothetical protein
MLFDRSLSAIQSGRGQSMNSVRDLSETETDSGRFILEKQDRGGSSQKKSCTNKQNPGKTFNKIIEIWILGSRENPENI